jgi:bifunctional non-homologous end joining protein LigD
MPQGIERSNLEKVFWPESGITKGDLLAYFEAVAPAILPAVKDRPVTVKRYPDGIGGFSFYQKDAPKYAPDWVKTATYPAESAKRDVRYILCNSRKTLLWLANQASIELHPWLSRVDRIERPDFLVLDVDPPENDFERAVKVALAVKEVLDEMGLRSVAKTSGAKGVHIYVPLQRRYPYSRVRRAAEEVAARAEELVPDLATTAFQIAKRGGRVYLDAGRVAPGAHVVAPYSPRARPAASVSFPVEWNEIERIRPEDFTIKTVPGIMERQGDRWRSLSPEPQALPQKVGRES